MDGPQIFNEIKACGKSSQRRHSYRFSGEFNFSHYITAKNYIICLAAYIISLGLAITTLIITMTKLSNLIGYQLP